MLHSLINDLIVFYEKIGFYNQNHGCLRDTNRLAKMIVDQSTGSVESEYMPKYVVKREKRIATKKQPRH